MTPTRFAVLLLVPLLAACASKGGSGDPGPSPATPPSATVVPSRADTLADPTLIPAGYGTLRQDDIALRVEVQQLQVKAIPLDESIIRVLSPDSYRALHGLVESQRARINEAAARRGLQAPRIWYVSFYALQPDVRFSPQEVVLQSAGREFRPLDIIPLGNGFGDGQLRQRETQSALYIFDSTLDLQQPIALQVQSERSERWGEILQRVERERALVRSRMAKS